MRKAAIRIGMDTAKSVFQLHGVDIDEGSRPASVPPSRDDPLFREAAAGARRDRGLRQSAPLGSLADIIRP